MTKLNQRITLPDGRKLGYNEYGQPDGLPVFYFHGTPSACVEWELFGNEELTGRLNMRLIAVDRPGMGL
jgi:pimeloyl-ACP methyl ester carboxylesterase